MSDIECLPDEGQKAPCYKTHPPLKIVRSDNVEFEIFGGSCVDPVVKDADVYVSLDDEARVFEWELPWNENPKNKKHIRFFIKDFSLPKSFDEFGNLIKYLAKELGDNKKIHVGCYGGHGRTGLVLSALTQELMGNKRNFNAIEYVRENYCKEAVETIPQVLYLRHFCGTKEPLREKEELSEFHKIFKELTGVTINEALKISKKDVMASYFLDVDKEIFYNNKVGLSKAKP